MNRQTEANCDKLAQIGAETNGDKLIQIEIDLGKLQLSKLRQTETKYPKLKKLLKIGPLTRRGLNMSNF